jgi:hypothetical protein
VARLDYRELKARYAEVVEVAPGTRISSPS